VVRRLDRLADAPADYDAIVLDQWGVLHDGSAAYAGAPACLAAIRATGVRLAVLSNSGKRSGTNAARIAAMGFPACLFDVVMTSGEALWQDIAAGRVAARRLCPIERAPGDAAEWAEGLDVTLTDCVAEAEAILLMGVPDGAQGAAFAAMLETARAHGIPVLCTNPDRASPRAGGVTVASPGALAHAHVAAGGMVAFYGKPHLPVFRAVEMTLGAAAGRILMVGDSLEHDIAGAKSAGWDAAFVEGGLHAAAFGGAEAPEITVVRLATRAGTALPDFTLRELR
jgi:HAD superfamily hydrolase (TIGR01459 family)